MHPSGRLLNDVLWLTTNFLSTDPRDHIYGLINLSTAAAQGGIQVNYDFDLNQVFLSAAHYLFFSEGAIDYLALAGVGRAEPLAPKHGGSPSWIPDLTSDRLALKGKLGRLSTIYGNTQRKGHFGLVPAYTEPGDAICVFAGACVPFVIRPLYHVHLSAEPEPLGPTHQLLGPCYIDGIMLGELKDADLPLEMIILE